MTRYRESRGCNGLVRGERGVLHITWYLETQTSHRFAALPAWLAKDMTVYRGDNQDLAFVEKIRKLSSERKDWPRHILSDDGYFVVLSQKGDFTLTAGASRRRLDSFPPTSERYFEDYVPGAVFEYGTVLVNEADIIDFARCFDPQDFHTDPEAAIHGPVGGLIASGWHTASMMMRLFADHYLSKVASLGSPGVDELRWLRPVRPGDVLRLRAIIVETRRSRSKPDRGVVWTFVEVLNQDEDVVMTLKALNLFRCRVSAGGK